MSLPHGQFNTAQITISRDQWNSSRGPQKCFVGPREICFGTRNESKEEMSQIAAFTAAKMAANVAAVKAAIDENGGIALDDLEATLRKHAKLISKILKGKLGYNKKRAPHLSMYSVTRKKLSKRVVMPLLCCCQVDVILSCPVCHDVGFKDAEALNIHVNRHFGDTARMDVAQPSASNPTREMEENGRVSKRTSSPSLPASSFAKRRKFENESASGDVRVERALNALRVQRKDHLLSQMQKGSLSYVDYHMQVIHGSRADIIGIDDDYSRTAGLSEMVLGMCKQIDATAQTLIAPHVDHFSVTFHDRGWGCGYRNIQMMWSALNHNPVYQHVLKSVVGIRGADGFNENQIKEAVPSVIRLQELIEKAWEAGYDIDGGLQLGMKLVGGSTWIGATEAYSLFASLGIKCRLIDFWKASGPNRTHPELFSFLERYFTETADPKAPVYLQEHGHSLTISGFQRRRNGRSYAIVFDPGHRAQETMQICRRVRRSAAAKSTPSDEAAAVLSPLFRGINYFKAAQYQLLVPIRVAFSQQEQQRGRGVD
ncbi:unnamed protein product [Notodromas monacha]|uniref:UFSP1/2/DUB catalytic domain-containing protein n=1 Tax=Notodromas monacha TaxID=399045 RepID=A0A7R9GBP3_9CRUS|nr:unnamed protein product [Notodromas monacha]CAG0915202.1 unnamed protein product [Notodromas monacha]